MQRGGRESIDREGRRVKRIGVLFAVIAGLVTGTAREASATVLQSHALNTLEFSYVESVFGADGTRKAGFDLSPGDHLVGIISVNRITAGGETIFTAGPEAQLTGVYAHKVLSVPPYPVDGGFAYDPLVPTSTLAHVEFGNPDLVAFSDSSSSINLAEILAPGEMFALWLDQGSGATAYTTAGSLANGMAAATDGLPFLSAGIGSSGYFYCHADPTVTLADLMQGALIGQAFAGLEVMTNATDHCLASILNADDMEKGIATQLAVTCDLSINPLGIFQPEASPWTLAGTGTAQIYPAPEPSTFALFGAAGVIIGLSRLRKHR